MRTRRRAAGHSSGDGGSLGEPQRRFVESDGGLVSENTGDSISNGSRSKKRGREE